MGICLPMDFLALICIDVGYLGIKYQICVKKNN